jgi:hypothetical protein
MRRIGLGGDRVGKFRARTRDNNGTAITERTVTLPGDSTSPGRSIDREAASSCATMQCEHGAGLSLLESECR